MVDALGEGVTGVALGSWVGAIGLAPFVWTPIVASAAQGAGLGPLADPTLRETTFVVVDLETTGTRGDTSEITEIGAVRSRGG